MPDFVENTPVTNPVLVEAMRTMQAVPTNESQNNFVKALLEAKFLSPALISTDSEGKSNIQFIMLSSQKHPYLLPLFTDWPELRLWSKDPNQQTVITTLGDIMAMMSHPDSTLNGAILNPFNENIFLDKELLKAMSEEFMNRPGTEEK